MTTDLKYLDVSKGLRSVVTPCPWLDASRHFIDVDGP